MGIFVQLTAGEVRNSDDFARCLLAVVSDITLDTSGPEPVPSGGLLRVIDPWTIEQSALRALT